MFRPQRHRLRASGPLGGLRTGQHIGGADEARNEHRRRAPVQIARRVDLFDAANVGAGPIATLAGTNRETIPLVLHSAWMPAFHELADAERLRFSDEITPDALASVPEDLHAAIHEVAAECDALW